MQEVSYYMAIRPFNVQFQFGSFIGLNFHCIRPLDELKLERNKRTKVQEAALQKTLKETAGRDRLIVLCLFLDEL